jgi:hypothetical protein
VTARVRQQLTPWPGTDLQLCSCVQHQLHSLDVRRRVSTSCLRVWCSATLSHRPRSSRLVCCSLGCIQRLREPHHLLLRGGWPVRGGGQVWARVRRGTVRATTHPLPGGKTHAHNGMHCPVRLKGPDALHVAVEGPRCVTRHHRAARRGCCSAPRHASQTACCQPPAGCLCASPARSRAAAPATGVTATQSSWASKQALARCVARCCTAWSVLHWHCGLCPRTLASCGTGAGKRQREEP